MLKFQNLILAILLFFCVQHPLQAGLEGKRLTADYVVVGVGTAGAVVAKRLSDDKETSVIALCRGENLTEDPLIKFSKNALITVLDGIIGPPFYVNGQTTPQSFADDRELLWTMATPEGGASSINAGAYCRGTNEVYAQWEAIAGPLWSVDRILEIYKELETYHGQTPNPIFRGEHGPISVRQVPHPSQVSEVFTTAIINGVGVPFVQDYNDPLTPIGASSQLQYTQSGLNGRLRVSSGTAFLNESVMTPDGLGVDGRKLRVLFNSIGLRTIWNGNKAVGVEYSQNGKTKRAFAKKGVIVCAGLFSSAFLMHSGIGPREVLETAHVPVLVDNPNVGRDLADQPHVVMVYTTNPFDTPEENINSLFNQISWLPAPGTFGSNSRQLRFTTANLVPGIALALLDLVQPKSRGRIFIKNNDPLTSPEIDPGELSNPDDLNLFVQGFQVYVKAINAQLQLIDPLYQMIFPDPAILDDREALINFIKDEIDPNQHWQSHCRMAPRDQGGVVNSKGQVYGVKNLYVADNSISPQNMDGSPMATGYLIGANIARIIHDEK